MPTAGHTKPSALGLIAWTPFGIALLLIVSMMSSREVWLYVAAVIGVLVSVAVGRTSRESGDSLQARLWRFAKGWLLVVALAAISLLHGKWQPMAFFALAGGVSSAFFWVAGKSTP
jgi:hypothetical protein